eukprot:m.184464 g.184464  ORF g.184464 m.184464 type:complete len:3710 (+) comp39319_c1_seq2:34-11163(+)
MASHQQGFEQQRLKLQTQRVLTQQKTFSKWINSFLPKSMAVRDLFADLQDGRVLMKLLEAISGEKIGAFARGSLRIHKLENVQKALDFLSGKKVKLESIGAHDIVDGNQRLILGLLWTIILRFQIQDISLEDESKEIRSAKDALLLWCQRKSKGYPNVAVKNFTTSWCDGLAFCAIIHKHRPDLIDFASLKKCNPEQSLNLAFDVAEQELGIARLLDAEDVNVPRPDDKSIMTYLVSYYNYFTKMKFEETAGRRVAKVIGKLLEVDKMQGEYDQMATNLLVWIQRTMVKLSDRKFPNRLAGVQSLMADFKRYRTVEKPPKYAERSDLEVQLFNIQTNLRALKRRVWVPAEGKLISDVNKAWEKLEAAEHERELALRSALQKQEQLEQLADRFNRKAGLREAWLGDMDQVLTEMTYGETAGSVAASLKRHEAVNTDVRAREERIEVVVKLADQLIKGEYREAAVVRKRQRGIQEKWDALLAKLQRKRNLLASYHDLIAVFSDVDDAIAEMSLLESGLRSDDFGKHLTGVEDLIQKHSIVESDITSHGERVKSLQHQLQKFEARLVEVSLIKERQEGVSAAFKRLNLAAEQRKARLNESLQLQQFYRDAEEEEAWIREKEQVASSVDHGKDLVGVMHLIKKHEALEAELQGQDAHLQLVCRSGESLQKGKHYASKAITARIGSLTDKWRKLKELTAARKSRLNEAYQSQQYYADANDSESWMKEKEPVVSSDDYGRDFATAKNLLQSHERLEGEVKAYHSEIDRLQSLAKHVAESSGTGDKFGSSDVLSIGGDVHEELVDVEEEYEVEEMQKREVVKEVVEEVKVPQVKSNYLYKGQQGISAAKGEVFVLVKKTNKDWWQVRNKQGKEGFLPANYVADVDPMIRKKMTQKKVTEMVPVKVKKKRTVKKAIPSSRPRVSQSSRSMHKRISVGMKQGQSPAKHFDSHNVASRQQAIDATYGRLVKQAEVRRKYLEDSINLFELFRDCDEVESWITDKEAIATGDDTEGRGREHVETMRKKFDTFKTDLASNSIRVLEINNTADHMVKERHSQGRLIRQKQQELNQRWEKLQKLKAAKEQTLEVAESVQQFQQTCDEVKAWINEKDASLTVEDTGKDLVSVQALQRRHQNLERELGPVEEKLLKLGSQAEQVMQSHPRDSRQVKKRQAEIQAMWDKVKTKAGTRKSTLEASHKLQEFHADSRDLLSWAGEMKATLMTDELAQDANHAEELIEKHGEKKTELDAHEERFEALLVLGKQMLSASRNAPEVRERMKHLTHERQGLRAAWAARNDQLQECLQLQLFNREAEQVEGFLGSQEAMLANEDMGSALDTAENLLKRHEEFEGQVMAQEDRVAALSDHAHKLINDGHYDAASVAARRDGVLGRRQKVKALATGRRLKLHDSVTYQKFKRNAAEVTAWMNEKLQIAGDESYKDPTNLAGKLQKHQAFEAELAKNKDSIDEMTLTGNTLCRAKHYASADIKATVDSLVSLWSQLSSSSSDKGQKLKEAANQQQFARASGDFAMWLRETEAVLRSDDLGKDLSTVTYLLKKHQLLENDIQLHGRQLLDISDHANVLVAQGHFNAESIRKQLSSLEDRFSGLSGLMEERRSRLEAAHEVHQFFRNIEDEGQWIREHIIVAASPDVGSSLTGVHNLQKRHDAFAMELDNHLVRINDINSQANKLVASGNFASEEILQQNRDLQTSWKNVLAHSRARKRKLGQSLEAQQYYFEATEADVWMNEKAGIASNQDYGKDEDTAEKYLQKHRTLAVDVEAYVKEVTRLEEMAQAFIAADHFDSTSISARQSALEEQLLGLQTLTAARRQKLEESIKLHQYLREFEEAQAWLQENQTIASSEEYGKDFEHLELLQEKFDIFKRSLQTSMERYTSANAMARRLVADGHSQTVLVKEKQDEVKAGWNTLQGMIATRTKKLAGAGEIHKFRRDAGEVMGRIQEKEAMLVDGNLGRNLTEVESLLSKHGVLERELVALGTEVRKLGDEAGRLEATYPGSQAARILDIENEVTSRWDELQARAMGRRSKLKASMELQKFNNSVRGLLSWYSEMDGQIMAEEPAHSVGSAEEMIARHNGYKAEIDAREDGVVSLRKTGERLILQGHFAVTEIKAKLEELARARVALEDRWVERRRHYNDVLDQQQFYRDCNQVDGMSSAHEAFLHTDELGDSVDAVEALVKKHEAFGKLVSAQEDKVSALVEFAGKLKKVRHFDVENFEANLSHVLERRNKCKEDGSRRKSKLEENRRLVSFHRDCMEVVSWIKEKMKTATDESYLDLSNLAAKLQKHQAFESELAANEARIDGIQKDGEALIGGGHYAAGEVEKQLVEMLDLWGKLNDATVNRGNGLAEALALMEFNREADMVESWIRDKSLVASQEETGGDLEHCEVLQRKFDDFENELPADAARLERVNEMAAKLVDEGHSRTEDIENTAQRLNESWDEFLHMVEMRKSTLEDARQVHKFNRDADEANLRIHEKGLVLSTDDFGKDLPAVDTLLRKHDELQRDLTAIEGSLEQLNDEAQRLIGEQPANTAAIETKLSEIIDNWDKLIEQANQRKMKLEESKRFHQFQHDLRNLRTWKSGFVIRMTSDELAKDVEGAERMLETHQERKAEMEARAESFTAVKEFGLRLIGEKHFASGELRLKLDALKDDQSQLASTWEERGKLLNECFDLQRFNQEAEQVDAWIGTQEAFLLNDDVGDSLDGVETLMKNHDDFEKSTLAQEEKMNGLERFGRSLIGKGHYEAAAIDARMDAVLARKEKLLEMSKERKARLEDSRNYQQFRRDAFEVENWIQEKMQTACDESYQDPSNLQVKLQQHNAFESELSANESRIDKVALYGEELVVDGHFAHSEIESRVDELRLCWQKLRDASADKTQKLKEAQQQQLFNRNVEDIEAWIGEVATLLSSEDFGKDLAGVKYLMKKHQLLENDIAGYQDRIDDVLVQVNAFKEAAHFKVEEIEDKGRALIDDYYALTEPTSQRRARLEASLELQQFFRDIDDELAWIREREPVASASDLGQNLTGVRNLMKKHQALEGEIVSHFDHFESTANTGHGLMLAGHQNSDEIQSRIDVLKEQWEGLQQLVAERKQKLQDSEEGHQYYAEAAEAESWMETKRPLVASEDYGRDEDTAEMLAKKHEAVSQGLEGYKSTVEGLAKESNRLISKSHFDAEKISQKQSEVEEKYKEFMHSCGVRTLRLKESQKLHEFSREAAEVEAWIGEKERVAASEEYGNDLEHCELLQKKFEDFTHDLLGSEERVVAVDDLAQKLIDENHFDAALIADRREQLRQLWADVNELTSMRVEALGNARQIHAFNRDVDETKARISEKDAALSEDYGRDLATVQALQRKHEGFERDLTALKEMVEKLAIEAERLMGELSEMAEQIESRLEDMHQLWESLVLKADVRKVKLGESEQLQRYINEFRTVSSWIMDMKSQILADDLASDVPGAEALITRHKEHKAEMDARKLNFDEFLERGGELVSANHYSSEEILEKMDALTASRRELVAVWEAKKREYDLCLDIQLFRRDAEQAEGWIGMKETFLTTEELGGSLEAVEALLKKQDDFEKTLAAQEEKFRALNRETEMERQQRLSKEKEIARQRESALRQKEQELAREQEAARKRQLEEERRQEMSRKQKEAELERQQLEEEKRRKAEKDALLRQQKEREDKMRMQKEREDEERRKKEEREREKEREREREKERQRVQMDHGKERSR